MSDSRKKILVVSNLPESAEIKHLLEADDTYHVFSAGTFGEGLAVYNAEHVDFVLSDLDLPDDGGDKLCEAVKKHGRLKKAYFVFLCAGKKTELQRAGKCGADTYIRIPAPPSEIVNRVGKIIDLPQRRGTRVLVKVTVNTSIKKEPFFCTSQNISISGLLLESERALAREDAIMCSFFLPDRDRIDAQCVVRRVMEDQGGKHLYGVEFKQIDPTAQKEIEEFTEEQRHEGNFI